MRQNYYQDFVDNFVCENTDTIFGKLAKNHQHDLEDLQKNAWLKQIALLKNWLYQTNGRIHFEFSIPRMGKRVDNIILINNLILVVEFKVGETKYTHAAQNQTIDYCLDLLNFHEESHNKTIIPILIATQAPDVINDLDEAIKLEKCICCNSENFRQVLDNILQRNFNSELIEFDLWEKSRYHPTPTIIEAAQALYKGHNVNEISRSDSGAINLTRTSSILNKIIDEAKSTEQKTICFLTGVPGAGKTLAGLNIANARLKKDENEHSVFLSGNGPLVQVLREALTRDSVLSEKEKGNHISKTDAERQAKTFIQNIHHFRDDNLKSTQPPIEKVVIFDEAQRAWQKDQVSKFMRSKKGIEDFDMSEPEYLISVMDRHPDWCSIVCLIGGGQEINTGEAGLSEWIISLKEKYSDWTIHYSDKILEEKTIYLNDKSLVNWLRNNGNVQTDLHLAVSVRSFRSEKVAAFVQNILSDNEIDARQIFSHFHTKYPIYLTRSLQKAKIWLKNSAKGSERIGIIASSGARRLRSDGIYVKNKVVASDWFLNEINDVRSSYYMEDVATEFDIQGLEIDYTCVAWDINLYYQRGWQFQNFKGSKWQKIKQESAKNYLINSYRVLLTRARQGMIIFIPETDGSDLTRPSELYNSTFQYLKKCGLREI